MAVDPNDILRIGARQQIHGTDTQMNVFYLRCDEGAAITDTIAESNVAAWVDALYACVVSHIVNSIEFTEIQIFNVTQNRPMVTQSYPTLTFGQLVAYDLPWGVALLQSYETGVVKVNGRKYFGGLSIDDVTDAGYWASTLVTLFACVLLKMVGSQVSEGNYYTPGTWSRGTALFHPFKAAKTSFVPAYQRRRRPGHGE